MSELIETLGTCVMGLDTVLQGFRFNEKLMRDLEATVDRYSGQVTYAEVVGCLQILAFDLMHRAKST